MYIYMYIYTNFSVLDEATCALSEEAEHQFYTSLRLVGVTVMSVGHRSSLKKVSSEVVPTAHWNIYCTN